MPPVDIVLANPYVLINAVDYSSAIISVSLPASVNPVDNTSGSAAFTKSMMAGLKEWSMEFKMKADFSASGFDTLLFAIWNAGAAVALEVRPAQGARSTSNPAYTGTAVLLNHTPFSSSVGDLVDTTVKFVPGGTAPTLLRQVA